jgi:hypothetical protein
MIGRYVLHENVLDYMLCGWMWRANIGDLAALMVWPCGCRAVEPAPFPQSQNHSDPLK